MHTAWCLVHTEIECAQHYSVVLYLPRFKLEKMHLCQALKKKIYGLLCFQNHEVARKWQNKRIWEIFPNPSQHRWRKFHCPTKALVAPFWAKSLRFSRFAMNCRAFNRVLPDESSSYIRSSSNSVHDSRVDLRARPIDWLSHTNCGSFAMRRFGKRCVGSPGGIPGTRNNEEEHHYTGGRQTNILTAPVAEPEQSSILFSVLRVIHVTHWAIRSFYSKHEHVKISFHTRSLFIPHNKLIRRWRRQYAWKITEPNP
jgi:hypothetical protein